MRSSRVFLAISLCSLAAPAFAACYTVYDGSNRIVYQSDKPPVDMSLPLHETVPKRFPGGQLVFDVDGSCPVVSPVAQGDGGPITRTSSPLLTDQPTAKRLHVSHRVVDGVAVIPPAEVIMKPGVTVVPSTAVASKNPPATSVLGGPPVSVYPNPAR
jgi:hypothetical protein